MSREKMDKYDWLGKIILVGIAAMFIIAKYYRFYIWEINCDEMFEKCVEPDFINKAIKVLGLLAIYIIGICNIAGSINPYYKKQGSGKIKQAALDYGYKHLGILPTNLLGLWVSGLLQTAFLCVSSPYLVLFGLGMPLCYWAAVTFTGDTKWAEYAHGFVFGIGIMIGVLI